MIQIYDRLSKSEIPKTRLISFAEFKRHEKGIVSAYILKLLAKYPNGLTCTEISDISSIYVQSLTYPLKTMVDTGILIVSGLRKSTRSNRNVQVYRLNDNKPTENDV